MWCFCYNTLVKLEEYAATVQKVEDLKTTLETKRDDLEETQTEYEAQQTELNTTISEKSAEVENLDSQIQEAARKAAEEAARKAAEEEAAREADNAGGGNGGGGSAGGGGGMSDNGGGSSNSGGGSSSNSGGSYNPSTGNAIVDAAYTQLGVPYVWGGTTPYVGLDCSGLVQWCYAQAGISIPRTSGVIMANGTKVSDPQPGDICWTPGHVAIYIGGGQMIEAQQSGVPICISPVRVTYYIRYT